VAALPLLFGSLAPLSSHAVPSVTARDIAPSIPGRRSVVDPELEKMVAQLRGVVASDTGPNTRPVGQATPTLSPPEALKISPPYSPRIANGQEFFKGAHFVGAETCKECHAPQYDDWRKTWHSKMEAWPTASNVKGDFNNRVVTYHDIKVKKPKTETEVTIAPSVLASKEGDKFYMTLLDKDNPAKNVKYEIAKLLGGNWDQHYEVKIDGRYYPTPMRWSVQAGDWLIDDFPPAYNPSNWFEYDGTADGTPKRPQTGRAAEGRCAGCHTTGYEFKKVAGLWQATGNGEFGNACENCHGPASKHIEEARSAKVRGEELRNSTIAHPLKDLTPFQQSQICAQCHGRAFNKQYPDEVNFQIGFRVGDSDITDHYNFWNYSGFSASHPSEVTKYFWSNDWAKKNRQQWQDFTKSAHYNTGGMSCLTCHAFHDKWEKPQLRAKAEDICTTCHVKDGVAAKPNKEMYAGSVMQEKGVRCVDCHMPKIGKRSGATEKGGPASWDVSSHTFLLASPSLEKSAGVRNACAECHMGNDKTKGEIYTLEQLERQIHATKEFTRDAVDRLGKEIANLHRTIDALPRDMTAPAREAIEKALFHIARADQNVGDIVRDGSFGFHNKEKSRDLLRSADDWIDCAKICVEDKKCDDKDHAREMPNGKPGKCYVQIGTKVP
jgi:predicted CXXCH cytochrome family protein